jgi:hypothetical protein
MLYNILIDIEIGSLLTTFRKIFTGYDLRRKETREFSGQ